MNSNHLHNQHRIRFTTGLFVIFISSQVLYGQQHLDEQKREEAFYQATQNWFAAWELVSKDIYKIEKVRPVEFVFFDDQYVYSTSNVTIKNGPAVKGCNLINLKLKWRKALHHDSLTLPDKSVVPVSIMSFAAALHRGRSKSFFIMPLPSFWEQAGVKSKELGLMHLITGVFIHEFSHSQQMQNFGKTVSAYEHQYEFGTDFSDDIVQHVFGKDSSYLELYKTENNHFYHAVKNGMLNNNELRQGWTIMKQRQRVYFKDKYQQMDQVENLFLTMEGLGQYSMFLWLIHPAGGNIKRELAIDGVRRGGRWWSQDEGFALFLILEQLSAPANWAGTMFGTKAGSVVELIEERMIVGK